MSGTLEVAGISVRFEGIVALDDVSLQVRPNEIVGVIGPNGAGKTTLFNAICRFVPLNSGRISYGGRTLSGRRASQLVHQGIARTLQGLGFWPSLSVLENVVGGAPARNHLVSDLLALPGADRRARELEEEAMTILDRLGIAQLARARPVALPHGAQKRVVLARAMMARPSLLLLDEPASGLSAVEVEQLSELLRELREHSAIGLVEHHLDMVMAVSDQVTVLNLGRVIASGSPAEIRANTDVTTAYLGQTVAHA